VKSIAGIVFCGLKRHADISRYMCGTEVGINLFRFSHFMVMTKLWAWKKRIVESTGHFNKSDNDRKMGKHVNLLYIQDDNISHGSRIYLAL